MPTPHYGSGDEIKIGDKVECPDGMTGEVAMVIEMFVHPAPPAFFSVRKSDGTRADYQPSDPGVRLVSRLKRMTSSTMDETIKKAEFLKLLEDLGSHSTYYVEPLSKQLTSCGLSAAVAADGQGLIIEGQLIPLSTPEWGDPGISTLSILGTVYELATGEQPRSKMSGRGFWYKDVMSKLASFWGIDANYL